MEIFGQNLDTFFLHDMADDGRWYFEILHGSFAIERNGSNSQISKRPYNI